MEDTSLSALDSRELDRKLRTLLGEERNVQVDFLLHLDRFDRAHGQETFGYAKLWDYCRRELGLLNGAIWRRVHAMDLLRRYPAIEARLRDGRISMTALGMLEKVLTAGNVEELLDSVVGKSTREIEVLVASFNAPVPTPRRAATRDRPHPRARAGRDDDARKFAPRLSSAQPDERAHDVWPRAHGAVRRVSEPRATAREEPRDAKARLPGGAFVRGDGAAAGRRRGGWTAGRRRCWMARRRGGATSSRRRSSS